MCYADLKHMSGFVQFLFNRFSFGSVHRAFFLAGVAALSTEAGEVVLFDFREGAHGWHGNQRIKSFEQHPEDGLVFESVGHDPWVEGPSPDNLPLGKELRLTVRMRSTGDSGGEVFYGRTHWEDHANGHGFLVIEPILETAAFSGDEALIGEALALLDKQARIAALRPYNPLVYVLKYALARMEGCRPAGSVRVAPCASSLLGFANNPG